MNPTIKARIEKIKNGEVPEGYKRTKIGIVPNEWSVEPLRTHLIEYRNLSNDIDKFEVYSSSRNGLMSQSEYYNKKTVAQTNLGYKTVPEGYVTYRHMSDDDIFHFNLNQTGKTILVSAEYPVFNTDTHLNIYFLVSYLNNMGRFRYFCRGQKMGGTRTRLYFSNLGDFKLSLPPIAEQQKIAEILATQDKVIELKEKLLKEKQRQKKYLMQQLLTGKKRLPSFSGEWKEEKLSDFCSFIGGGTPDTKKEEYWNGKIPWVSSSDLVDENVFSINIKKYINQEAIDNSATKLCPINSILVVVRVGVGKVAISKRELCTSQDFLNIFQTKQYNIFLLYAIHFLMKNFVRQVQGTAIKGISVDEIKQSSILFPEIEEQTAIAQILSTADKEIELLKKSIEQEKLKKKSLMQLLLTGIVRVNEFVL